MKIFNTEDKMPKNTPFQQQKLKGLRFNPGLRSTLLIYGFIFIFQTSLGIYMYTSVDNIKEIIYNYTDISKKLSPQNVTTGTCNTGETCQTNYTFNLEEDWNESVYISQQLDNYQQNHRELVKSRNYDQLKGIILDASKLDNCGKILQMSNLRDWQQELFEINRKEFAEQNSIQYQKLTKDDQKTIVANPCGMVAKTMFQDKQELFKLNNGFISENVNISDKNLVWDIYISSEKYWHPKNYKNISWIDVQNNRFIAWMTTAGLPSFRKLWGIIPNGLPQGNYLFKIYHLTNVVEIESQKSLIMSTKSIFGGKNYILAKLQIAFGGLAFLAMPLFCIKKCRKQNFIEK